MRWTYVERQRKQKFDNIGAGHEAFARAMGLIADVPKPSAGPTCPAMFIDVYEKYRSLKFVQRDNGESLVLYPREQLSWQDLVAYKSITGDSIGLLEAELIMGIDGIFEGREDG